MGVESGARIMQNIAGIRRFGTVRGDDLYMIENLSGSLDVTDVDRVEVALLATNRNYGAPRQDFAS